MNSMSIGVNNSSLTASDSTPFRFGVNENGEYGYIITDSEGADTVIPFKSRSNIKLVITFTSAQTGNAGYTNVYINDEKTQSIGFTYGTNIIMALGFLSFTYNAPTAVITALHECTVDGIKYNAGDEVATLTNYITFKNHTFTVEF